MTTPKPDPIDEIVDDLKKDFSYVRNSPQSPKQDKEFIYKRIDQVKKELKSLLQSATEKAEAEIRIDDNSRMRAWASKAENIGQLRKWLDEYFQELQSGLKSKKGEA